MKKKIVPPIDNYLFVSSKSFVIMRFNICSFNSLSEKNLNYLSNLMNLFFIGFNAAYLLFFNWTICALLALLFFVINIFLLLSSNIANEILELFISNSLGVVLIKLYLLSNCCSFDILSGWKEISN